jgi:hypothetical protein
MSSASWLIQGQGIKKEEYIEDPSGQRRPILNFGIRPPTKVGCHIEGHIKNLKTVR